MDTFFTSCKQPLYLLFFIIGRRHARMSPFDFQDKSGRCAMVTKHGCRCRLPPAPAFLVHFSSASHSVKYTSVTGFSFVVGSWLSCDILFSI